MTDHEASDATPTDDGRTAGSEPLERSQAAIDDAKSAAAAAGESGSDRLIDDDDVPVADEAEPADGPAPAS